MMVVTEAWTARWEEEEVLVECCIAAEVSPEGVSDGSRLIHTPAALR